MKKIVSILLLFIGFMGYSQTNGITYQAVIFNPSGEQLPGVNNANAPLANKNICLRFTIIDHNSQPEYIESIQTTTDEFGMVNLIIGTGLQLGGYATSFSNILWNANPKNLKVDLSATGVCAYYTEISNQPFTSVPFALYAVNSESTAAIAALQATVAANATATTAALATKENTANKSTTTTLGTSNVLFPTQNAVKTYVDTNISTVNASTTALQATVAANAAATTTALATKEDAANKSTTTTLGTSNVLFPTQNAVKTYVDTNITNVNASNTALQATVAANAAATTTALGLKEDAANKSTTTTLGTSNVLFPTQNAVKTYVDTNITNVNASNTALQATVTANATAANNAIAAVQADVNQNEADADAADLVLQNTITSNAAATTTALGLKEDAANKSTTTTLGTSNVLFPTQNAVKTYVDTNITTVNASNTAAITTLGNTVTSNAAATTTALGLKEDAANKSTTTTLGTSNVLFPTQNAVKTYVDAQISSATIADADATTKGKIQLAGDLTGTAAVPVVANNAIITAKIADASVTDPKIVGVSGSKVTGNISGSAANVTGIVPVANGGTGVTTVAGIKSVLGFNSPSVAIGDQAGQTNQGSSTVGVGGGAGATNQGGGSVAVGYVAGYNNQGNASVAIGSNAAQSNQGTQAVAVGYAAGQNGQGANSVAIGAFAGQGQAANSIALNATGAPLNPQSTGFYVAPVRNASESNSLFYNTTTKEITYGTAAPTGPLNLATGVTSTLPIANGGTGATNAASALSNFGAAPIASPTFTGTVTAPIYASTPQALTDAATIVWNPANGLNASVTLGGNRTLSFTATPAVGSYGTLIVTQDATGGRTITLPSTSNKVLGSTSTTTIALSSAANAKDILNFYYDGTNCYWNIGQGYGTATPAVITNLATGVSGTLPVANGGSGAATLTGYIKGNGTSAMTANASIPVADVTGAAPLASPTFTGTPVAPTASAGTNTTQVATTEFVTGAITTATTPDATISTKGKIQLAGDLAGTAAAPTVPGLALKAPIASPTFTGAVTAPIYASTPQALTDAATISWNPANGLNASVTLGGNRTLSFTTTPTVGSYGTLVITQDATGGRTITLPSTANKVLGSTSTTTVTLSSAAGAKDILNFYYDGTNCYWNVGQGYGTAATVASTNLTSSVSGTLPIANGGTGATTKATAFDALSPMTSSGDIIYGGLNGTGTRLSKGSNGSILTMENDLPTWNTSIKATPGSSYNAPVGFSFIGGDWARNTGMFSDNPDAGGSATLKFRIATSNSTANSYLEINPSKVSVLPTTASTSKTTGALTVAGGLGVNGDIYTNNLNASGTLTAPIYASTPQALTDAATITWNPANGLNASVTLGGNRTLSFTTTPAVGSYGTLVVSQDATGGRTITLPSTSNKVLGSTSTTTITLSSAANAKDILNFYYDGTNCYWNIGQGYGTAATVASTNLTSSVSGTLPIANGGTGATSLTANNVLLGNGTSALQVVAPGTSGNVLTSNGTTWSSSAPAASGVPYTGATQAVNLGAYDLTVNGLTVGKGRKDTGTAYQYNSAFGVSALGSFTGGTKNTALGFNALSSVTSTDQNIAIGAYAMGSTTDYFQQSVAVGNQSLQYNKGSFNTALGSGALSSINLTSAATYLVGVGALALNNNSTGQNNTAVGSYALSTNTTGNNNTALGQGADVSSATLDNTTAIGYNAKVSTSNTIQLGNTSVTNVKTSGSLTAGAVTYPNAHGTANQVLSTSGTGTLTWTTPATVRLNSDEISATGAQTSFTLTQTPLGAKVWMFVNGVRIRNAAYTISGATVTYVPASNSNYALVAGDRIQFDYAY